MKRVVSVVCLSVCLLGGGLLFAEESPRDVLESAKVFLDFGAPDSDDVVATPGFESGVALDDAEKVESLARGGDGRVARVARGAYATVSDEINAAFNDVSGRSITFGLRVKFAPDVWRDSPVMSRHGGHNQLAFNIFCLGDRVGAEVGTTKNNSLMQTFAARADMLDPEGALTAWHDVYCRVDGVKMELFVDGRCYDEDFMLGDLLPGEVPFAIGAQYDAPDSKPRAGFEGEIDFLAFWDRALTNDEIRALSGGEKADSRERTERATPESLQYWTPPGSYGVGDCMPFTVDGVFHFMYLLDKNRHGAKNGLGAHQWIQATSMNLKDWEHQPFVLPISDQNEGSICTGSVFFHDGTYYAFYANRAVEYTLPSGEMKNVFGLLCMAESRDGVHFEKRQPQPILTLPEGYGAGTRDPVVFENPGDGRFHMYATTSFRGKGCWAHAVSDDLKNWTLLDPVYTHLPGEPECPDWFKWGDYYYVIANHLNGYYKRSKSPLGPWEVPDKPNVLMTGYVNVPKTAPFGDDRRIICGWTRERGFGGAAVFHELVRFEDGTLGEKFVPEMMPETDAPVFSGSDLTSDALKDLPTPPNFRFVAKLTYDPTRLDQLRDVVVRYAPDRSIRVVFSERAVYLNDVKLERVDLSTGVLELDCFATSVVVDLCVNGVRTATFASREQESRAVSVENDAEPNVAVKFLEISPLKER